ncbi:ParB/RepB/Spo0J family partition protein [Poseidonocella sp. HB161398]|uniref:ParB/RepB/Spo0J family partition protein n=1 Tax=Poseidonocella sp. HB161398 TaxID=2320855 RepID=UPI0011090CDA|nr:ParB/RepB/Spo0J family partition protein [Poseidonocella sp. HB161398]
MKHATFDITHFPVAKLHVAPENPRSEASVDPAQLTALADSIAENGVLVPLIAYEQDGMAYAVSGGRRTRALHMMAEEGSLEDGFLVPVRLIPKDGAGAAGSTEQITQQRLSDLDELMVYNQPGLSALSDAQLARRLGKSVTAVKQRRAVHSLPEDVLQLVLDGSISVEQGYGLTYFREDEGKMRELAETCTRRRDLDLQDLRRTFENSRQDWSKSALAALTTREAYLEAGGKLQEDLFAETSFILTPSVLETLAHVAGEARVEVEHPGAAFIRFADDIYGSTAPDTHPGVDRLDDAEREEWSDIRFSRWQHNREDEPEWFARYDELEAKAEPYWPPELKALLGVVWAFGWSAKDPIRVRENCLPEDREHLHEAGWLQRSERNFADSSHDSNTHEVVKIPAKLVDQIRRIKLHCLRMHLAKKPDEVLVMFALQLANPVLPCCKKVFLTDDRDIVSPEGIEDQVRSSNEWMKLSAIGSTEEELRVATPALQRKVLAKQLLDRISDQSVSMLPYAEDAVSKHLSLTEEFFHGYRKPHLIRMIQDHTPASERDDAALDSMSKGKLAKMASDACQGGKVFLPPAF